MLLLELIAFSFVLLIVKHYDEYINCCNSLHSRSSSVTVEEFVMELLVVPLYLLSELQSKLYTSSLEQKLFHT